MIGLNDNSILVGEIKQILANFNLPLCPVGVTTPIENRHFLTKDHINIWKDTGNFDPEGNKIFQAKNCDKYVYGKEYNNLTSKFQINNLVYDRTTHRYLGKYLRFIRDYWDINLMSMYNCFDGELNNIDVSFKINERSVKFSRKTSEDITYKIPVSLRRGLTISTHGFVSVEMCIYVKAHEDYAHLCAQVCAKTYKKGKYNKVIHYDPLHMIRKSSSASELEAFLDTYYNDVYLLIKVPVSANKSIVVLEGTYNEYTRMTKQFYSYRPLLHGLSDQGLFLKDKNKLDVKDALDLYITASIDKPVYANFIDESGYDIYPQLLSHENASKNYLLADRLIEYLTKNAITPLNDSYEIKNIQKFIDNKRRIPFTYSENQQIKPEMDDRFNIDRYYGIWHESDARNLKTYIANSNIKKKYDSLGYIDKDIECEILVELDKIAAETIEGDFKQ